MENDEDEGQSPEIWFGAAGSWCEFGLSGLDRVIAGLDRYTVDLQALRYRYATALAGTELTLHHPEKGAADTGIIPGEMQLVLEQYTYGSLPTVALTIEGRTNAYTRLSLAEARQVRSVLGEMIAMAETCATPSALPPLDCVTADMRAKVVEDSQLDPGSSGYALGDSDPDGRIWACVPAGLSPEVSGSDVSRIGCVVPPVRFLLSRLGRDLDGMGAAPHGG
ncbi:hypothetical protein [Streptomyces sp. NPDC005865]|uniref:hypothetical protein n=1 Tax=Streptomyces sp. NPDC005865 TaxID=3155453 RepID=UPI0033FB3C3E